MKKEKSIVAPPSPQNASQYYAKAKDNGIETIINLIFLGLELEEIFRALKKCNSCTFDQWLDINAEVLQFSRRSAFNYRKGAVEALKKIQSINADVAKRFSNGGHRDASPVDRDLFKMEFKKVFSANDISQFYQEIGVARLSPGANLNQPGAPRPEPSHEPRTVDYQRLIQEDFFERLLKAEEVMHKGIHVDENTIVQVSEMMSLEQIVIAKNSAQSMYIKFSELEKLKKNQRDAGPQ